MINKWRELCRLDDLHNGFSVCWMHFKFFFYVCFKKSQQQQKKVSQYLPIPSLPLFIASNLHLQSNVLIKWLFLGRIFWLWTQNRCMLSTNLSCNLQPNKSQIISPTCKQPKVGTWDWIVDASCSTDCKFKPSHTPFALSNIRPCVRQQQQQ